MKKFIPVAAVIGVFAAACNDMPVEVQADPNFVIVGDFDKDFNCNDYRLCFDGDMPSDTVPYNLDRLLMFVVDGRAFSVAQLYKPGTRLQIAGLVNPSDTVPPAPLQHGVVQSYYARFGGSEFASLLSRVGLGSPAPSDTVPGPGPMGMVKLVDYNQDGIQDFVVFASAMDFSKRGIIGPETNYLQLSVVQGKSTKYFPASPVTIIAPEKVISH